MSNTNHLRVLFQRSSRRIRSATIERHSFHRRTRSFLSSSDRHTHSTGKSLRRSLTLIPTKYLFRFVRHRKKIAKVAKIIIVEAAEDEVIFAARSHFVGKDALFAMHTGYFFITSYPKPGRKCAPGQLAPLVKSSCFTTSVTLIVSLKSW